MSEYFDKKNCYTDNYPERRELDWIENTTTSTMTSNSYTDTKLSTISLLSTTNSKNEICFCHKSNCDCYNTPCQSPRQNKRMPPVPHKEYKNTNNTTSCKRLKF